MFTSGSGGISAVTGLAEPEYGESRYIQAPRDWHPSWIHTPEQLFQEEILVQNPSNTNVETATFYINDLESGYCEFAQIIHSNIGITTSAPVYFQAIQQQKRGIQANLDFSQAWKLWNCCKKNFKADNFTLQWNEDGSF